MNDFKENRNATDATKEQNSDTNDPQSKSNQTHREIMTNTERDTEVLHGELMTISNF